MKKTRGSAVSRIIIFTVSLLLLSGCAFNSQTARLAPTVNVQNSNEGNGVSVAVRVVDERTSKSLGHRGTAYGAAAEITAEQDVAVVVHEQLVTGLQKKGFNVVDYAADASPRLTVEVRGLEYSTSQGFWTGGVKIESALKVQAVRGTESFDQMYRSNKEERVVVVPTAATNEQWINSSLSDVLNQLFGDIGLFRFLAE
ncbi:MAG: hypothetical protein CVV14_03760 [Gammaproteobacteria bacterium HGW-Gammaproteobacteria-4]|nr:MAG: hypothetical protein CVV14_03760 [Gammaproteobacteria bacterium HGW-Gammaproteobacteria-4]